jgi:hypothetical protein
MGRVLTRASLLALLVTVVWAGPASAASRVSAPRAGGAFGILPAANTTPPPSPAIPVVYHGGPVMRGVTVHTIFWAPPGFHFSGPPSPERLGYQALIQQFLTDVAADPGTSSSVFSVLPEFSDAAGPGSSQIHYDPAADTVVDTDPLPAAGRNCASPAGIVACVTDGDVRREVNSVIAAHDPAGRGLSDLWFVFLPPNLDECLTQSSCGTTSFAGYHGLAPGTGGYAIYSAVPEPTIEINPPPGSDPQGNPVAESAIDTVAHELIEAITNPDGDAWMDPNGFETADKCESGPQYGAALGYAANGSPYNQVINGHQYLIQMVWSNRAPGCVQSEVPGADPPRPPQVYLTQFSPFVSGAIGVARADVRVQVLLQRAGDPVALAEGRTRADGTWGPIELQDLLTNQPHGLGDDRDVLTITYGAGGPRDEVIATGNGGNPFTLAGWTGWYDLDSGFSISSHSVSVAPCSQTGTLRLRIGGTLVPSPTQTCVPDTNVSVTRLPAGAQITNRTVVALASDDNRAPYVDNPFGALVRLAVTAGEPGSVSVLSNAMVPFAPTGLPACTGDLQSGRVACSGLVPGAVYTLIRGRGRSGIRGRAGTDGIVHGHGFAGPRGLRGGDTVTLRNSAGRVLTVLHVSRLRVHIVANESVIASGICESSEYYGPGLSAAPTGTSVVAFGPAGSGTICPPSGDATGLPSGQIEQIDDLSGGITETTVPVLAGTSPVNDGTVYGSFTALAGASLPGPNGAVTGANARVTLKIVPAGGHHAVFSSSNVNLVRGVHVAALTPGVYKATWGVVDQNGDTRSYGTRFIQAP